MNCARARFVIYAYLDREISSLEGEALSRHLGGCGACAAR
ncbi:MAG: zf-HC2 domain-containing protein, partial [Planctomycetota bacterium]